jgi:hypothetical protein
MLLTSMAEVRLPCLADLIFMLPDEAQRARHLAGAESVVLDERDLRGKPELRFAAGPLDVDMQAGLLAGEEVEAQATRPENAGRMSACTTGTRIAAPLAAAVSDPMPLRPLNPRS